MFGDFFTLVLLPNVVPQNNLKIPVTQNIPP